mgnify:CR=1 FL=1
MKNWALQFALKHEGANVDTIYYTENYFALDGLTNPATAEAYTEKEIADIKANAVEGNDKYIFDAKDGALIGMKAFNTGKVFWYDAENGKKIVSSAAPLLLDGEAGEFKTAEGETVAVAL